MTQKKTSIRDWVYPDGDPVEQYDKRILDTFCDLNHANSSGKAPRYDHTTCHNILAWNWTFLGYHGDFDLWYAKAVDLTWHNPHAVGYIGVKTGRYISDLLSYIESHEDELERNLLLEAKARAILKGLI